MSRFALVPLVLLLTACTLGPDYQRPSSPVPSNYRHLEGWKQAQPQAISDTQKIWALYGDQQLLDLLQQQKQGSQSLAASEAQYRKAQALLASSRAERWPSLKANTGVSRTATSGQAPAKQYDASLAVSWEADLWGKLRRQVEADQANLEASFADWGALRLSQQSALVQNYLSIRLLDQEQKLLDETLQAYRKALTIAENQYRAGLVARSDVTQALTQLNSTAADAKALTYQRAQLEHALATLLGQAPEAFKLAPKEVTVHLPAIAPRLPAQLLERRPDVAAAERRVMAANAAVGVAKTAYFPDLTLSASGGYRGSQLAQWISAPNRMWSIGPDFAMTLFDGGLIASQVAQAQAEYDKQVADYRQSILTGLQEVEDYLVQLAVQEEQARLQEQALQAARQSLELMLRQYQAGVVDFTQVVTVQTAALSQERNRLALLKSQLLASVQLIVALGGDWQPEP